jgi:hypothetical protein
MSGAGTIMSTVIDGFPIDAAETQGHTFGAEVTSFPVETGADVTDNVRLTPAEISLDCIVSDTPIGPIVALRDPLSTPSDDAYARLLAIRAARLPVVVVTARGRFENMMLTSLSIPVKSDDGKTLRFTVAFREVRFVANLRTQVRVAKPRSKKKVDRGPRTPKATVTDAGQNATVASGYQDTWLGRATDSVGITAGPQASLVPDATPETRAVSAAGKW